MLGADLVPPCHLRNNCARGKGFRNDPALLRLGPATPTPNTCPDFYSAARPRSVKYIVDHICEPIPSNRSTSADLSKPPQGAVRRPLTVYLMEKLRDLGAKVAYSDPHVPAFPRMREHHFDLSSTALTQ